MRSLIDITDLASNDIERLLEAAQWLGDAPAAAPGPGVVVFLSDRESVRTRIATHQAARLLGMGCLDLRMAEGFYADPDRRPDADDFVEAELASLNALGCAALVIRHKDHSMMAAWARAERVPIINGCSAESHPLQALADALTLRRLFGRLEGLRVALVGNGHLPVFRSFAAVAKATGMQVVLARPDGYGWQDTEETSDLRDALTGADVVYADSITYRKPTDDERDAFASYRLTRAVLANHAPSAWFMHCLPHAEEVTGDLVLGSQSLVLGQVAARVPVTAAAIEHVKRP